MVFSGCDRASWEKGSWDTLATTLWVYHPGGKISMGGNFYPEQGVQIQICFVGIVSVFYWNMWETPHGKMPRVHWSFIFSVPGSSFPWFPFLLDLPLTIFEGPLSAFIKVVLAQISNIQILARGCQTTSQAISPHALSNTGVRDYSSPPSPRPVALPQFYHSLSVCFSIDTLGRWP